MRELPDFVKTVMSVVLCCVMSGTLEAKTDVTKRPFGKMPDGTPVEVFALTEDRVEARIITYGGIVVSLKVQDKSGKSGDVVLGFDKIDQYVMVSNGDGYPFFGEIVDSEVSVIAV